MRYGLKNLSLAGIIVLIALDLALLPDFKWVLIIY